LPDTHGHVLALKTLLDRGPVVISFYRGGWCPFCNLELRGLQGVLPEIVQVGASLVAISPQLPGNSLSTEEKNQLTFPVLSDVGNGQQDSGKGIRKEPSQGTGTHAGGLTG
jgi:peroxiredoxin